MGAQRSDGHVTCTHYCIAWLHDSRASRTPVQPATDLMAGCVTTWLINHGYRRRSLFRVGSPNITACAFVAAIGGGSRAASTHITLNILRESIRLHARLLCLIGRRVGYCTSPACPPRHLLSLKVRRSQPTLPSTPSECSSERRDSSRVPCMRMVRPNRRSSHCLSGGSRQCRWHQYCAQECSV